MAAVIVLVHQYGGGDVIQERSFGCSSRKTHIQQPVALST